MAKYYYKGYDRRMGGDFVELYDENFERVAVVKTYNDSFGRPKDKKTDDYFLKDEVRILRKSDPLADAFIETEPIEGTTKWVRAVRNAQMTEEQRDNATRNVTGLPKRSRALVEAQDKYDSRQRRVMVRFDERTDAELIAKLDKVPSMQAYIKDLIRRDLEM